MASGRRVPSIEKVTSIDFLSFDIVAQLLLKKIIQITLESTTHASGMCILIPDGSRCVD